MTRKIDVTNGAVEYLVGTVTERNGLTLEGATITVGLGTYQPPETWQTPDVLEVDGAVATVKLLVDDVAQIGTGQALWVKVDDTPEVLPRRAGSRIDIV